MVFAPNLWLRSEGTRWRFAAQWMFGGRGNPAKVSLRMVVKYGDYANRSERPGKGNLGRYNPARMEISYQLTEDDYRQGYKAFRRRTTYSLWRTRIAYAAFFLILAVALFVSIFGPDRSFPNLALLWGLVAFWTVVRTSSCGKKNDHRESECLATVYGGNVRGWAQLPNIRQREPANVGPHHWLGRGGSSFCLVPITDFLPANP